MNKYIKEIKVFTFPELNGEAKEKAKEWYLNDEILSLELTNDYKNDLSYIFPRSELEVQWSLSYCQGDGVNIYGSVNIEDIFALPGESPCIQLDQRVSYRKGNPYFKVLYERVQE